MSEDSANCLFSISLVGTIPSAPPLPVLMQQPGWQHQAVTGETRSERPLLFLSALVTDRPMLSARRTAARAQDGKPNGDGNLAISVAPPKDKVTAVSAFSKIIKEATQANSHFLPLVKASERRPVFQQLTRQKHQIGPTTFSPKRGGREIRGPGHSKRPLWTRPLWTGLLPASNSSSQTHRPRIPGASVGYICYFLPW